MRGAAQRAWLSGISDSRTPSLAQYAMCTKSVSDCHSLQVERLNHWSLPRMRTSGMSGPTSSRSRLTVSMV